MSLQSFIQSVLPFAQSTSASTGLPLDFVLAQSALETGAGTSNAAQNYNNYFGISPGGTLAYYPDTASGFGAYGSLINSRYPGASGLPASQIGNYLQGAGYATDPAYGQKVASLLPSVDSILQGLGIGTGSVTGSQAPVNSASNPSTGSSGGLTGAIVGVVSRVGVILLAIVVVGVGLWMLAKN